MTQCHMKPQPLPNLLFISSFSAISHVTHFLSPAVPRLLIFGSLEAIKLESRLHTNSQNQYVYCVIDSKTSGLGTVFLNCQNIKITGLPVAGLNNSTVTSNTVHTETTYKLCMLRAGALFLCGMYYQ